MLSNEKAISDLLKLKEKNEHKKRINKWITFTMIGILLAFITNYLIIYIEIFSPGLAGISQGISYLFNGFIFSTPSESKKITVYWTFYILLNIPIFIFAYKLLGKKFFLYSFYVLMVNITVSLFFTFVPGFNSIQFFDAEELKNSSDLIKFVSYSLIALIGGIGYGYGVGLALKKGGSTFGLDPIVKWLGRTKQISIGKITFIISIINSFIWTLLFSILNKEINSFTNFLEIFLNPKIFASIVYFTIISFVSSKMYSVKNKRMIEVNSTKIDEISYYLNNLKYHRNHTILRVEGGYTHKERKILQTIINEEEMNDVLKIINIIDPKAFIFTFKINNIYGNFNNRPFTLIDLELIEKQNRRKEKRKIEKLQKENSINDKW